MKINKVTAAYFSPTKGTAKYVLELAKQLCAEPCILDLTDPKVREQEYVFGADELVILGAPVYAGRLPEIEGGIFERLKGNQTPAIFMVSYGNREFEDALLEEQDICQSRGFVGIAAGAWIAPHTFSDKIAAGRPDAEDFAQLHVFAEAIQQILQRDSLEDVQLQVPGNRPYRDGKKMPFHPQTSADCTNCKHCASVCPTGAIALDDPQQTDTTKCIDCLACVKECPTGARAIAHPAFAGLVAQLEGLLTANRKAPQFFLP